MDFPEYQFIMDFIVWNVLNGLWYVRYIHVSVYMYIYKYIYRSICMCAFIKTHIYIFV